MQDKKWIFATVLVIVIFTIAGLIWIPAIAGCNAVNGELVINAFNWPVCVNKAGE